MAALIRTTDPNWIALSDHAGPLDPAGIAEVVQRGSLVLEFGHPKDAASVLLDYRAEDGWPRAFSILQDEAAGIVVLHRQGERVQRLQLPGPLPRDHGIARLTYAWDGPARHWSLQLEDTAGGWVHSAVGANPMPLTGGDLQALCAGPNAARRDGSVIWFGVCLDGEGTPNTAWIGLRTPIDTQKGFVAAGELQIGDLIATLDNGYQPLRGWHRMVLPNRGRFGPVLLRAPYYARQSDLLVAPRQLVLMSGVAVEYLFGEDAVLAPASALRDGNTALSDTRRPVTTGIALDLGRPEMIFGDDCALLCSPDSAAALPYRLLLDYEVVPLQSQLGRGGQRSAA